MFHGHVIDRHFFDRYFFSIDERVRQ